MMLPGEDEALVLLQRLCERHGYGWIMQQASRMWREKDPIGAISLGPCYGSLAKEAKDRRPHPRGEMWRHQNEASGRKEFQPMHVVEDNEGLLMMSDEHEWTVEELEDAGWRGSIGEEDGPK